MLYVKAYNIDTGHSQVITAYDNTGTPDYRWEAEQEARFLAGQETSGLAVYYVTEVLKGDPPS